METEVKNQVNNQTEWTPENWREMSARFAGRHGFEDDQDESEPFREEAMNDVFDQMRANKAAAADPATEAARRKVAATEAASGTVAELIELSKKVQKGDPRAQEKIIRILDSDANLSAWIGDLSQRAEVALIEAVSDDVFAFKLARARRADSMRRELLAACSTPLEKMAAQNVVASWLQIQVIDENFASAAKRGVRLVEWTKMQERAAKRYQNAVRSLELATKASQALNRSNSSAAAAQAVPIAAAPAKGTAGKVQIRSKPAKPKPDSTLVDKPPTVCVEQTHCETPTRPRKGANRTTHKPANRVTTKYTAMNGAPASCNGHATPEPVVGVLDGK